MESETSDSELKLSNANRRLLKLESDVALLEEKALNTSTSANSTEKDADSINALTQQLKKVHEFPGYDVIFRFKFFAFVISCAVDCLCRIWIQS